MNGEKYTLEFYRKGFFGYGKEGEFRQWSFTHFAVFIVLAAGILPLILFGAQIRDLDRGRETAVCPGNADDPL